MRDEGRDRSHHQQDRRSGDHYRGGDHRMNDRNDRNPGRLGGLATGASRNSVASTSPSKTKPNNTASSEPGKKLSIFSRLGNKSDTAEGPARPLATSSPVESAVRSTDETNTSTTASISPRRNVFREALHQREKNPFSILGFSGAAKTSTTPTTETKPASPKPLQDQRPEPAGEGARAPETTQEPVTEPMQEVDLEIIGAPALSSSSLAVPEKEEDDDDMISLDFSDDEGTERKVQTPVKASASLPGHAKNPITPKSSEPPKQSPQNSKTTTPSKPVQPVRPKEQETDLLRSRSDRMPERSPQKRREEDKPEDVEGTSGSERRKQRDSQPSSTSKQGSSRRRSSRSRSRSGERRKETGRDRNRDRDREREKERERDRDRDRRRSGRDSPQRNSNPEAAVPPKQNPAAPLSTASQESRSTTSRQPEEDYQKQLEAMERSREERMKRKENDSSGNHRGNKVDTCDSPQQRRTRSREDPALANRGEQRDVARDRKLDTDETSSGRRMSTDSREYRDDTRHPQRSSRDRSDDPKRSRKEYPKSEKKDRPRSRSPSDKPSDKRREKSPGRESEAARPRSPEKRRSSLSDSAKEHSQPSQDRRSKADNRDSRERIEEERSRQFSPNRNAGHRDEREQLSPKRPRPDDDRDFNHYPNDSEREQRQDNDINEDTKRRRTDHSASQNRPSVPDTHIDRRNRGRMPPPPSSHYHPPELSNMQQQNRRPLPQQNRPPQPYVRPPIVQPPKRPRPPPGMQPPFPGQNQQEPPFGWRPPSFAQGDMRIDGFRPMPNPRGTGPNNQPMRPPISQGWQQPPHHQQQHQHQQQQRGPQTTMQQQQEWGYPQQGRNNMDVGFNQGHHHNDGFQQRGPRPMPPLANNPMMMMMAGPQGMGRPPPAGTGFGAVQDWGMHPGTGSFGMPNSPNWGMGGGGGNMQRPLPMQGYGARFPQPRPFQQTIQRGQRQDEQFQNAEAKQNDEDQSFESVRIEKESAVDVPATRQSTMDSFNTGSGDSERGPQKRYSTQSRYSDERKLREEQAQKPRQLRPGIVIKPPPATAPMTIPTGSSGLPPPPKQGGHSRVSSGGDSGSGKLRPGNPFEILSRVPSEEDLVGNQEALRAESHFVNVAKVRGVGAGGQHQYTDEELAGMDLRQYVNQGMDMGGSYQGDVPRRW